MFCIHSHIHTHTAYIHIHAESPSHLAGRRTDELERKIGAETCRCLGKASLSQKVLRKVRGVQWLLQGVSLVPSTAYQSRKST